MDLIATSYESAGFSYSNLRLMSNLRAERCSRSNVHVHIGAQCMSLGLQKHFRGRDVSGLPLHRKITSRRNEYQVVGMRKLRASLSENIISRSRREQSNKDELTSLEALASNATLIAKRGPAFKGRKDRIQDFIQRERPPWLEIHSLEELKSKIGHVIIMILLVGLFKKSKRVPITTSLDMVCFSASILLSSACIFLLSKLSVK